MGYGDISANNSIERVFCIFIMLIGVMSFSYATGSLSSMIQNYDEQRAKHKELMHRLNSI